MLAKTFASVSSENSPLPVCPKTPTRRKKRKRVAIAKVFRVTCKHNKKHVIDVDLLQPYMIYIFGSVNNRLIIKNCQE